MPDSNPGPLPQKSGALLMSHHTGISSPTFFLLKIFFKNQFKQVVKRSVSSTGPTLHFYESEFQNNLCLLSKGSNFLLINYFSLHIIFSFRYR